MRWGKDKDHLIIKQPKTVVKGISREIIQGESVTAIIRIYKEVINYMARVARNASSGDFCFFVL